MSYTCKTCGALSDAVEHLCSPCDDKSECSFCGAPEVDARHVCKDKLSEMKFVCGGCGRLATEEGGLCEPQEIVS